MGLLILQGIQSFRQGQDYLRRLHEIPCSQCQFYTHCAALKCTIHPHEALTEAVISCQDFEPTYRELHNL